MLYEVDPALSRDQALNFSNVRYWLVTTHVDLMILSLFNVCSPKLQLGLKDTEYL